MPTVVAIHQPNFLPWLGYFDKIFHTDHFVILDNVQFPKGSRGNSLNRIKLFVGGKPSWCTLPIIRTYHGFLNCNEIIIQDSTAWRKKLLKTIQINYSRAPYFRSVFPLIEKILENQTNKLMEFNIYAVRLLLSRLNISRNILFASELSTQGKATDLLISIVKAVGGDTYLCGGGASGYQEDAKFAKSNINLVYQNFQSPYYKQFNTKEFVGGLSILDALLNCGFEKTADMLNRNIHSKNASLGLTS